MLIRLTFLVLGLLLNIGNADDIALEMSEHPNIWTDGSREDFSSVAGVYLSAAEVAFDCSVERCRAFYACSWCHADCSAC